MSKGFRKIWMYLIPLALLAIVATCDTDLNIKNPFSETDLPLDSTTSEIKTDLDSLGTEVSLKDSLKQSIVKNDRTTPDNNTARDAAEQKRSSGNQKMWRLIIGSVSQKEKAETLAAKSGYPNIEIIYIDELSTYRLVYGSYANLKEAQQEFTEIQDRFPEAWMVFF